MNRSLSLSGFLGNVQKAKIKKDQARKGLGVSRAIDERKNILDLNILVGVDCSGSISANMFHDFMVQLHHIKGMSRIKVVEVSDRIEAIYDFTRQGHKVARLKGGGGNGEHLFFDLCVDMKPDAIIYMTDGHCTEANNPRIPTAWILTKHGVKPYAWGEEVGRLPH